MPKYTRAEIEALSQRLDARAASTMFPDQPNLKSDIRQAAMLLRMLVAALEVRTVETGPCNDGQRAS